MNWNIEAEWMEIATFMVEQGYRVAPPPGGGLLCRALDVEKIERDLRRKMAHVIIPDKPRLH
jgi:hypothetical protein